MSGASAPNRNTLVISYSQPVAPALAQPGAVLHPPQARVGQARGHKRRRVEDVPARAAPAHGLRRPVHDHAVPGEGHDRLQAQPYFYGPKSTRRGRHAHVLHELRLDGRRPHGWEPRLRRRTCRTPRASALKRHAGHHRSASSPATRSTNLGFNSNPQKPKNRELLDPTREGGARVRHAAPQIVNVVFRGHARPWANIMSAWSAPSGWINPRSGRSPTTPPRPTRSSTRSATRGAPAASGSCPATAGAYAQPAHPMSYNVVVPDDLDFDGDRAVPDPRRTPSRRSASSSPRSPAATATQAYTLITAPEREIQAHGLCTRWYWHPYIDPNFNLSVVTTRAVEQQQRHRAERSAYDRWWNSRAKLVNSKQRQALVWKMEAVSGPAATVHPAREQRHDHRARRRAGPASSAEPVGVLASATTPAPASLSGGPDA